MQSDVEVYNRTIRGTSKYVTGYTDFSSLVEEQSGNYIAIKATAVAGATIVYNGATNVTLDADGMIVIRLKDGTKSLTFTATKGGISNTVVYSLSGLTKARA